MTRHKVIEAHALSAGTSAQKAESLALTKASELSQGKRINIYTDSKYAFMVVHAHGVIWKERGRFTSRNKDIKHPTEILNTLEPVNLPAQVVIMHFPEHQKDNSQITKGNQAADGTVKQVT